jgi:hypothetical protein
MDKDLPINESDRKQTRIRYYQWVPFLLLFQAILCYMPRIFWRTMNVRSGLDLVNLVDASLKYDNVDKFHDRDKIMSYIVRNVERYIGARRSRYERLYGQNVCAIHKQTEDFTKNYDGKFNFKPQQKLSTLSSFLFKDKNKNFKKQKCDEYDSRYTKNKKISLSFCRSCWEKTCVYISTVCFWKGKRLGNYLVVLYMFVKTLWLTNAIGQLFMLNRFIGNDYHAFGLEIINTLLSGHEWHELKHFPRVTYCDFKIREIGNQHDWTVQCVLRINLFNEVNYF